MRLLVDQDVQQYSMNVRFPPEKKHFFSNNIKKKKKWEAIRNWNLDYSSVA